MLQNKAVVFLIILLCIILISYARMSFINVNCTNLDKNFADFEYCYLKAVNRSYQYWSVKAKLYKIPVTNITLRLSLLKRANGYKPFLYNYSVDACAFLKGRRNPVNKFFYKTFEGFSNMNHTCPFNHDVILEKLSNIWIDEQFSNRLPMPKDDYAIYTTWLAYNIPRASVKVYIKLE